MCLLPSSGDGAGTGIERCLLRTWLSVLYQCNILQSCANELYMLVLSQQYLYYDVG